jgi:hypothetical protein
MEKPQKSPVLLTFRGLLSAGFCEKIAILV